jgi:hypothetical protein
MKLFIILALLISTSAFAKKLHGDHSTEIVKKVESIYAIKCTHKKDTMAICFGGTSDPFGRYHSEPAVCFYSKKYNCSNQNENLKLKIKMSRAIQWTDDGRKVVYSTLGTVIRSKYNDQHKEFTLE